VNEPVFPEGLPVWASLRDAARLYRLLFQRSVFVAAVVYGLIALLRIVEHALSGGGAALFGLVASLAFLAGPELVQGALIAIVKNVHDGQRPERTWRLFTGAWSRIVSLIGASFIYVIGVVIGLVLLVVPGLIVLARWSLMPAVVMLEGKSAWESRERSSALVRGQGRSVFMCLLLAYIVVSSASWAILFSHLSFGTQEFLQFLWSSLTAPFLAHLLTVIYYRRADQGRPVIDPAVLTWRSVWEGR
jgi:hypothetical protein